MKVGAVYPQIELGGDPHALREFAVTVESLGFDHLVMYDHVMGAVREDREPPLVGGPYTEQDPFHDPLTAFSHLAALTTRLEFVSGVLVLPQRQTALVARQAADIQLFSGGRLHLGVGTGWNYVEYDALGETFGSRGPRLTEQLNVLRKLWTGAPVTFSGDFHQIDRAAIVPAPESLIPILCGGASEPAFRRAAAHADGFIFAGPYAELALPSWLRTRELLESSGRPIENFRAQYTVMGMQLEGLPIPELVRTVRAWEDNGGTHATVGTIGMGFSSVGEHLAHLTTAAGELGLA